MRLAVIHHGAPSRGRKWPGLPWGRGFLNSSTRTCIVRSAPWWHQSHLYPEGIQGYFPSLEPSVDHLTHLSASYFSGKSPWMCDQHLRPQRVPHRSSLVSPGSSGCSLCAPPLGLSPYTQLLIRIKGITVHPAQSFWPQPDILVWASQPWSRLCSRQCGKGFCLAQLSPTHWEFSRDRLDSSLCPHVQQSGTWEDSRKLV